jgi:hypothetical protein
VKLLFDENLSYKLVDRLGIISGAREATHPERRDYEEIPE